MSTIEILEKNECCGCSSCVQKCPKNAISMIENEEGFLYPVINKEKCVDCGLCSKVCPQLKEIKKTDENYPKAYAMYNKNEDELLKSSSGGIFSVIANYVLENNGVVFGAAYDEDLNVNHIKVENKEELQLLRKSKYVQSNINYTYKETENILKSGKKVLFSGTPCQVSGLKTYLMKEYDNLITCDLVCHGVPSQKSFNQYLLQLEEREKSKIKLYDFRTKDKPEYEKLSKVIFKNENVKYLRIGLDCYYNNFLIGNMFRESCYKCKYANMQRIGDITIGDFLGVNEVQPKAYNRYGISICIINTNKGEKIINLLSPNINIQETTVDKIKKYNSNLNCSVKRPEARNYIYRNLNDRKLFIKDLKKYMNNKLILKSLLPIKLKKFLKKVGAKK